MANDAQGPADKIEELGELANFLYDLATAVPEHAEMLFRLSDNAKAEAEKLRRQPGADTPKTDHSS